MGEGGYAYPDSSHLFYLLNKLLFYTYSNSTTSFLYQPSFIILTLLYLNQAYLIPNTTIATLLYVSVKCCCYHTCYIHAQDGGRECSREGKSLCGFGVWGAGVAGAGVQTHRGARQPVWGMFLTHLLLLQYTEHSTVSLRA